MDPFVKRYTQILLLVLLMVLGYWIVSYDYLASDLNSDLARDAEIDAYPYAFKVLETSNGVATILTPRNNQVPATLILAVLYPNLKGVDIMSDEMQNAQTELAYIQSKTAAIVKKHPDIQSIVWQLDERWIENHGLRIN
jgi:hypothetical protein